MPRYKEINQNVPLLRSWGLDKNKRVHIEQIEILVDGNITLLTPHKLDFYALRFVQEGSGKVFVDHIPYEIKERWVMLASPEQISWVDIPEGESIKYTLVAFTPALIDLMGFAENVNANLLGQASHINIELDEENYTIVSQYFSLMLKEFEQPNPDEKTDQIIASLLRSLILYLIRISDIQNNPPKNKRRQNYYNIYRQFLESLSQHYQQKHYVADYVDELFINEKQLNRACKAVANKTASQVIQEHLMFEAKRLLFYSTNTIKEIGFHIGFRDSAHFIKLFKKLNGITPGEFRDKI